MFNLGAVAFWVDSDTLVAVGFAVGGGTVCGKELVCCGCWLRSPCWEGYLKEDAAVDCWVGTEGCAGHGDGDAAN